ncbi:hypothetical protein Dsin_014038 [Dipteronia sinensis]|uniref:Serine-threonine/tyrosine-protein kinase catalytic domain-containing protein n=1 Tax=Dipteronia sinensis TaxID=43782 RepID=A0AAE0ALK1_9ROSI|nr:hypothetical protein Dsin_014038 [Dipteronia sinensis]
MRHNYMRKKQVVGKAESKFEKINDSFALRSRQFTYSDIVRITKNFEKVLGKGGFGAVFLGWLDDIQVAVKMLSSSSDQGYKEFHAEDANSGRFSTRYCISNWLNEKSDVYSFGVVLLEIITSRPVIIKGPDEHVHLSQWVSSMLAEGDIRNIVDPSLSGDFDNNSAWKVVELALACAFHSSSERPTMTEIVTELNSCLAFEIARNDKGNKNKTKGANRMVSVNVESDFSPTAR